MNNHIELHSKDSFLKMHDAGKLAAEVLDYITDYVKPNVSTGYLNDLCHEFILKSNAIPAPLNYKWI
jgi:methionyl aminopeptidase